MSDLILSIVIPCFNEEEILNITKENLLQVLKKLISLDKISEKSYLLFVDDGSNDKTWSIIKELNKENNNVKGLKLSRNYGHQYALYAGLTEVNADIYISIDADLQDDINAINTMVDKYIEGYDIVYGVRSNRDVDPFFKRLVTDIYYNLTKIIGMKTIPHHADFRLISKKVSDELKKHTEVNLYLRGLICSFGFKSCKIYYKRAVRVGGEPKYNFFSLMALAIDGLTSFSNIPIRFISFLGIFCFVISILIFLYLLFGFFTNQVLSFWILVLSSLYFIAGLILLALGIIGEYILKIYMETKRRKRYIVEERL